MHYPVWLQNTIMIITCELFVGAFKIFSGSFRAVNVVSPFMCVCGGSKQCVEIYRFVEVPVALLLPHSTTPLLVRTCHKVAR